VRFQVLTTANIKMNTVLYIRNKFDVSDRSGYFAFLMGQDVTKINNRNL
jgi:hypothetical protein